MNQITIAGTVNSDQRVFDNAESGSRTGKFSVQDSYKDKDGNWHNITFDISVFNGTIELVQEYFPKGAAIVVTGEIYNIRTWASQSSDATGENIVLRNCKVFFAPRDRNNDATKSKSKPKASDAEELDM